MDQPGPTLWAVFAGHADETDCRLLGRPHHSAVSGGRSGCSSPLCDQVRIVEGFEAPWLSSATMEEDGDQPRKPYVPYGPPLPPGWDPTGLIPGPSGGGGGGGGDGDGDDDGDTKACAVSAEDVAACEKYCDEKDKDYFFTGGLPPGCIPTCSCEDREVIGPKTDDGGGGGGRSGV
jgi:hypothetical protein